MRFIKYTVENQAAGMSRECTFQDLSVVSESSRESNALTEALCEWMWRLDGDSSPDVASRPNISASLEVEEDERFLIRVNGSGTQLVRDRDVPVSPLPDPIARFIRTVPRTVFHDTSYIPSLMDFSGESSSFAATLGDILLRDRSLFHPMIDRATGWAPGGGGLERIDQIIRQTEKEIGDCDKSRQIEEIRTSRSGKLKREMEKLRDDVERMRQSIETYQGDQEMMGMVLKDLERRTEVEKRIEEIRKDIHDEQERQRRITEMRHEITAQFPRFTGREGTPDLDILQSIFIEARDLNDRIDQIKIRLERRAGLLKKWIAGINLSVGTAIGTLFLRSGFPLQSEMYLFATILGIDIFLTFILLILLIRVPSLKKDDELRRQRKDIEERLAPLLDGANMHLEGYRLSELYEFFLQYFEDFVAYSEKRRELGELEAAAHDGKFLSTMRSELGKLREENSELRKRIDECMGRLPLHSEGDHTEEILDLLRLRQGEIDILREDIDRKMKILAGIEKDLAMTRDTSSEIQSLTNLIEKLEERLAVQKTAREAISRVGTAMAGAVGFRRTRRLEELAAASHEMFKKAGFDSPDRMLTEENFYNFITEEAGSTGSVPHSMAVATKLALTDFLIDADIMLPLVINDPFHAVEDERIPGFRDIFLSVAGKRQVILITSRRDLADWGHFIEL